MLKQNASKHLHQKTPAAWATHEFALAPMADKRHTKRLQMIATAFAQQPTAAIPEACGNLAEVKATYRFVENEAIVAAAIREPHHKATLQRVSLHPVILAVQDTTTLNYSTHPCTEGLGPICHSSKSIGLLVHSTLAVTPTGQPLGFLHNAVRARNPRARVSSREGRKLADKESHKWIESLEACQAVASLCSQTTLVNITDREGDLYDLFVQALKVPDESRVELLVRAHHDRKLVDESKTLWQQVSAQSVAATLQIRVGRRGDQPSRLAKLNIGFCAVQLKAPKRRLLTTLPVSSAAEAIEKVRWYSQRWQIEVIHKVLKSGCKVEQRQLQTAERLERVLSIDLVVAWRVLALCKAARELPDAPISDWLADAQWQALWSYVHQRTAVPKTSPTVRQAVRWIAQLGGFLGRKSDGEPGTTTLWRGLQHLDAMTNMWELCHSTNGGEKCG